MWLIHDTTHHRRAVLLSTDREVDALLCDRQARAQAPLDVHCHARLTAVTLATLEARQPHGDARSSVSMPSLKRRAFNQHLIDRMGDP